MSIRTNPIGYAIIGIGTWGTLHLKVLSGDPRVNIVAVCDVNEETAKEAAADYNIPNYYTSYQEMLENPEIEAVSVTTPDFAHCEPALAVVKSGKNLLCEKPMATTLEESIEIIAAAKRAGVTMMVDFHNRWSPPFYITYENLRAGKLGGLKYAYFRLNDVIYVPLKYISWSSKSSALWFLGSHAIDSIRWLFNDEVREVFCASRKGILANRNVDTPDFFTYILQFESGGVATMENSWIVSSNNPTVFDLKLELQCSEGTIFIDTSHSGVLEIYRDQVAAGWDNLTYPDTMINPTVHGRIVGLATESIRHYIDCLWEGKEPLVTGIDGLRATEIILAAEESSKTNKSVKVVRNQV